VAEPKNARQPHGLACIHPASPAAFVIAPSLVAALETGTGIGEFGLRNRVRSFRTLGSVRGAVAVGYGEPKRARCRKRRIQPRGYLRTGGGFPYSEAGSDEYIRAGNVAVERFCQSGTAATGRRAGDSRPVIQEGDGFEPDPSVHEGTGVSARPGIDV
jgi:hypothetical protein